MVSEKYYLTNRGYYSRYSKDYYNKCKEEIKEEARNRYHNLLLEKEQKKSEYSRTYYLNLPEYKQNEIKAQINEKMKAKYHNMSDEEKQKHKERQKIYQKMYRAKKKQELENSKKAQGNFDKETVLILPKT